MHMAIRESGNEIEFLHTLKEGPAEKSYGLHVAKLAGLPTAVIRRATDLLAHFQSGQQLQLPLLQRTVEPSEFENKLRQLDLNNTTPIQALLFLQKICQDLERSRPQSWRTNI
jgi:DNA mismatch repair protein MutS